MTTPGSCSVGVSPSSCEVKRLGLRPEFSPRFQLSEIKVPWISLWLMVNCQPLGQPRLWLPLEVTSSSIITQFDGESTNCENFPRGCFFAKSCCSETWFLLGKVFLPQEIRWKTMREKCCTPLSKQSCIQLFCLFLRFFKFRFSNCLRNILIVKILHYKLFLSYFAWCLLK